MRAWVSINGELLAADEARVSVFDSGFLQGVGLFETMLALNGGVFRLSRHVDRLRNSARTLGWTVLPDEELMRSAVTQALGAQESDAARVRLTVTSGSLRGAPADAPRLTVVATASPAAQYPAELYQRGVTVVVSRYRQGRGDPTCGHKTTSYFGRLAALREAHATGAFEAIWTTYDGHVAEGSISSLFAVIDDELLTAPLETPVLPGISRATVMELAVQQGVPVREERLTIQDLLAADELFLTSSLMTVMPVVRIDRVAIGTEQPGELTRELSAAYAECVRGELSGEPRAEGQ